jgi:tellurium resistance protein TerD
MVEVINIKKGVKIDIEKVAPGIKLARVGLAWDKSTKDGQEFDLDVSVVCCNENDQVVGVDGYIFYNHPANCNKSVYISGDNRDGAAEGYDEEAFVKFDSIIPEIKVVYVIISIEKFRTRSQNFGQIKKAYCDVYNQDTRERLIHFDLTEDMSAGTNCIVARFRREDAGGWSFKAVGEAGENGLKGALAVYGIEAEAEE